jgi:hypothetical protein
MQGVSSRPTPTPSPNPEPYSAPIARQVHQVPVAVDQKVVDARRFACAGVTWASLRKHVLLQFTAALYCRCALLNTMPQIFRETAGNSRNLTRGLGHKGERLLPRQQVDQRGLAHVGAADDGKLRQHCRRALLQRLAALHEGGAPALQRGLGSDFRVLSTAGHCSRALLLFTKLALLHLEVWLHQPRIESLGTTATLAHILGAVMRCQRSAPLICGKLGPCNLCSCAACAHKPCRYRFAAAGCGPTVCTTRRRCGQREDRARGSATSQQPQHLIFVLRGDGGGSGCAAGASTPATGPVPAAARGTDCASVARCMPGAAAAAVDGSTAAGAAAAAAVSAGAAAALVNLAEAR